MKTTSDSVNSTFFLLNTGVGRGHIGGHSFRNLKKKFLKSLLLWFIVIYILICKNFDILLILNSFCLPHPRTILRQHKRFKVWCRFTYISSCSRSSWELKCWYYILYDRIIKSSRYERGSLSSIRISWRKLKSFHTGSILLHCPDIFMWLHEAYFITIVDQVIDVANGSFVLLHTFSFK